MEEIISRFAVRGRVAMFTPFGEGHINETYIATCDSGCTYLVQKISGAAFKRPDELMSNISGVCNFLQERLADSRASLHLIPTLEGRSYYTDAMGKCWRIYDFVGSSLCLQRAESPEDFYQSGLAFGRFQFQLSEYPVETLHETIPNFHNTPERYRQLRAAVEADPKGRAAGCSAEIGGYLSREGQAGEIVAALSGGLIPVRVTHNDTKLNNVLMDYDTRKALCVMDLDTVMPGSALYDFGDSIRFGASTAAEDERELDRVELDLSLYRVYTEGFLRGCGGSLTDREIRMLPVGAKLMTLECGARFLADYLNGDVYFHTAYPEHNLVRARTQLRLAEDMERKWEQMAEAVREVSFALTGKEI